MSLDRPFDREPDARQRGRMKDAIDAGEGWFDRRRLADIGLDQLSAWVEVFAIAGQKIVEHAHGKSAFEQRVGQMRPDEAAAARDQHDTSRAWCAKIIRHRLKS